MKRRLSMIDEDDDHVSAKIKTFFVFRKSLCFSKVISRTFHYVDNFVIITKRTSLGNHRPVQNPLAGSTTAQ